MSWKCPQKSKIGRGANWYICSFCGVWFNKKRNKKSEYKFCNHKCRGKFFSGEKSWNWDKGLKECEFCHKKYKFNYHKEKYSGRGKRFCSLECIKKIIKLK